jgi:DNA mismatch repair protein MutL
VGLFEARSLADDGAKTASVQPQRIRVLDEETIAQIAAGEVIDRPASVVKELVENSLDAGATFITVDLVDGGKEAIAVIDDGIGIARADLTLALSRHATSKLPADGNLFAIASLGFRGEGLASIAAAGALELTSRPASAEFAASVEARGVSIGEPVGGAGPVGTKIVVRELFSHTPARRAFLKSARAEFSRVAAYLSQVALGWPGVGFSLRHDGRDVWTLAHVVDAVDRLEIVFGRDARGALIEIDAKDAFDRERITGFIGRPGKDRPNRNGQVFFVNRRLVRSAALSSAWLAGYGTFGMTGRYPFGVLSIDVPPEDVDVNVHPTKIEVRFANPQAVFDAVRRAVARTLRGTERARVFAAAAIDLEDTVDREDRPLQISFAPSAPTPAAPGVRMLGQIDRTFIVAAAEGELVIIDQHAAHERIAYEAILESRGAHDVAAPMLFATLVELTPTQAATLHESEADLRAAGIEVEPFGDGAYRVTALPAGYEKRRFDLAGMLDDLAADDAPREGVGRRNRVNATVACHSVVRAGEALSLQEQSALYERLMRCADPQSCAHGRPTMLRLDAVSLAKAFKRQ